MDEFEARNGVGRRESTTKKSSYKRGHHPANSIPSSAASLRSPRKKYLFFGRSNGGQRNDFENETGSPHRPSTSMSSNSNTSRRSRADSWDNFRGSIFGRKAKVNGDEGPSRSGSIPDARPSNQLSEGEQFNSPDAYYHHIRLRSISRPYDFQHVAHTSRAPVTPLPPVDEAGPTAEYLKLEDVPESRPPTDARLCAQKRLNRKRSITDAPLILARPISPMFVEFDGMPPHLVEKRCDSGISETQDGSGGEGELPSSKARGNFPLSPQGILDSAKNWGHESEQQTTTDRHRIRGHPEAFDVSAAIEYDDEGKSERLQRSFQRHIETSATAAIDQTRPQGSETAEQVLEEVRGKALPLLPPKTPEKSNSTNALVALNAGLAYPYSPDTSSQRDSLSVPSKHSSHSSTSARQSSGRSTFTSEPGQLSDYTDGSWEDDVDFCYQQEAESTCEFNWDLAMEQRSKITTKPHHSYSTSQQAALVLAPPANFESGISPQARSSQRSYGDRNSLEISRQGFAIGRTQPLEDEESYDDPHSPSRDDYPVSRKAEGGRSSDSHARSSTRYNVSDPPQSTRRSHKSRHSKTSSNASSVGSTSGAAKPSHKSHRSSDRTHQSSTESQHTSRHHRGHSSGSKGSKSSITPASKKNNKEAIDPFQNNTKPATLSLRPRDPPMGNAFSSRCPEPADVYALPHAMRRSSQRRHGSSS